MFRDFGARLGIKDIHDFHERVAARQNEQGHRRQSIVENLSKSTNSIKYDEKKLADSRKALKRIGDSIKRHERKLRNLEVTVQSANEQFEVRPIWSLLVVFGCRAHCLIDLYLVAK